MSLFEDRDGATDFSVAHAHGVPRRAALDAVSNGNCAKRRLRVDAARHGRALPTVFTQTLTFAALNPGFPVTSR